MCYVKYINIFNCIKAYIYEHNAKWNGKESII